MPTVKEFIHEYAQGIVVRGRQGTVSVRNDKLFSYDTVIAERYEGVIYINMTSYSSTTTQQRNNLLRHVRSLDIPHAELVESVPVNTESLLDYIN